MLRGQPAQRGEIAGEGVAAAIDGACAGATA
jgi:hypothetical protein